MNDRCVIVIPARYASTRLPGKPLADIAGKPMIQHVVERAREVPGMDAVVVATDDARVAEAVRAFGGQVVMTSPDHPSGTDRLVEVMGQLSADIYINLQGDEPLVRPGDVSRLALGMRTDASVGVGTLCHPIDAAEAQNPNVVKVVVNLAGDALYFSRSAVPYVRQGPPAPVAWRHLGLYVYRRETLLRLAKLPPTPLEQAEGLEQLRALEHGIRLHTVAVAAAAPSVDTPDDLARVRALMAAPTQERMTPHA